VASSITVIIPALDEADALPEILQRTLAIGFEDVLVVDGGSRDGTATIADRFAPAVRTIHAPRGRARQMNAGAAKASGDVLVFLHADTRLPDDARHAIETAMARDGAVGGRFDVRFETQTGMAAVIAFLMNTRSRWTGIATGDQAVFVRGAVFQRLGGFRDIPIMEDIDFTRRLKDEGTVIAVRSQAITSFRRWQRRGTLRTIVKMWALRLLYRLGVSPHRLAQWYADVR
jgi:rSAM/selenodomain-associated transferase 2